MGNSKFKDLDRSKFVSVYNDIEKYPTIQEVGREFDCSAYSVKAWTNILRADGYIIIDRTKRNQDVVSVDDDNKALEKFQNQMVKQKEDHRKKIQEQNEASQKIIEEQKAEIKDLKTAPPLTLEERLEVKKMKESITSLHKDLRETEKQALTSEHLGDMIHGMRQHSFGKVPNWMTPKKASSSTNGIPCLFLSDLHFDEYVDPAQIGYTNEYSREIATKRIQHTFNTSIDILFNRTVNPKYDGMVIALGGDMLSGNIHEELAETNEDSIQRSLLALTDLLIDGIDLHLKHFKRIFIPCVVGNHGRHHKKPRAKNKVFDNYEWLIYQFIARHFKDDDRVQMLIPDGPDATFNIYNKGFLLTHGDQFRGGNAIAGIFSPLMLGFHRKQKKQASINKSFDVMMCGHFHQYVHTNQLIINGSVKGYDEFANLCNFAFERPQQALFLNHPTNGMVFRTPILCDSYLDEKGKNDVEKITVFK